MGRRKQVYGKRVERAIRESGRPFASAVDIGESLHVTPQAVRANEQALTEYEGLEKGKVGRTTVYWLSERQTPERVEQSPNQPTNGSETA